MSPVDRRNRRSVASLWLKGLSRYADGSVCPLLVGIDHAALARAERFVPNPTAVYEQVGRAWLSAFLPSALLTS